MSNYYAPCFYGIDFVVIPSWIEVPCENIIDVFSRSNKQQPTGSILVRDFNAKLLKWCPNDKDNKAGKDIDTFKTTWSYTQMIGQQTHIINDKSSCNDLLFTINSIVLSDVGVKQTIYDKCHDNIIYASFNLNIPHSPRYHTYVWGYKNTYHDMYTACKFIGELGRRKEIADEKVKSLNNILSSIFRNLFLIRLLNSKTIIPLFHPWEIGLS